MVRLAEVHLMLDGKARSDIPFWQHDWLNS